MGGNVDTPYQKFLDPQLMLAVLLKKLTNTIRQSSAGQM